MELENPHSFSDDEHPSKSRKSKFNFDEFIFKYRWPITLFLIGAILIGFGVFFAKDGKNQVGDKVEVLESTREADDTISKIVVEVSGAVESPGVYELHNGDRIEDALIAAKGLSVDADRIWMEKYLNRAAKVSDGQKIFIPRENEEADIQQKSAGNSAVLGTGGGVSEGLININTASQSELESLVGIGPVYAQSIIEQRPYSSVEELVSKEALKQSVYDKIKDKVSVY